MERKIQIVHLPEGHGTDRALLLGEIEKAYDKLSRRLSPEMFMEVHFKEFRKHGTKEQVETKAHAKARGHQFNSTGLEWDAMISLKSALDSLEKEVQKYHDTHKK